MGPLGLISMAPIAVERLGVVVPGRRHAMVVCSATTLPRSWFYEIRKKEVPQKRKITDGLLLLEPGYDP